MGERFSVCRCPGFSAWSLTQVRIRSTTTDLAKQAVNALATASHTSHAGHGGLFLIPQTERQCLDEAEGFGAGYDVRIVQVRAVTG